MYLFAQAEPEISYWQYLIILGIIFVIVITFVHTV